MLPHEHFLIACVPVVGYTLLRNRRLPSKVVLGAVLVGSLLPDLIDKPLAYQLNLIPHGRVFMHSLFFMLPVLAVVLAYGWQTNRLRVAAAYSVGHALHPLGDFYSFLLSGTIPPHLLWPVVSVPVHPAPAWVTDWTMFAVPVLLLILIVLVIDVWTQLQARQMALESTAHR